MTFFCFAEIRLCPFFFLFILFTILGKYACIGYSVIGLVNMRHKIQVLDKPEPKFYFYRPWQLNGYSGPDMRRSSYKGRFYERYLHRLSLLDISNRTSYRDICAVASWTSLIAPRTENSLGLGRGSTPDFFSISLERYTSESDPAPISI